MMRLRLRNRARSRAAAAYAEATLPPRETPWREAACAVVDLEMTGLDPRRDEIISFAVVPIDEGRLTMGAVRSAVIRPDRMPAAETIRVHGLRPADLVDAPPLSEALDLMLEALTGRIVVAHPARVERAFLSAAFKQAGVKLAEPMLCTARLAARILADARPDRAEPTLSEAARALGLPVHRPHSAQGDALTTAQLFLAVATRLDQREPQTLGSLARLSST